MMKQCSVCADHLDGSSELLHFFVGVPNSIATDSLSYSLFVAVQVIQLSSAVAGTVRKQQFNRDEDEASFMLV